MGDLFGVCPWFLFKEKGFAHKFIRSCVWLIFGLSNIGDNILKILIKFVSWLS